MEAHRGQAEVTRHDRRDVRGKRERLSQGLFAADRSSVPTGRPLVSCLTTRYCIGVSVLRIHGGCAYAYPWESKCAY